MDVGKKWDDSAVNWLVDKLKSISSKTWLARQTLTTANNNLALILSPRGAGDGTTSSDDIVYRCNSIYANPSTGKITARGYTINGKAEIQYDDTNKCINLVFN